VFPWPGAGAKLLYVPSGGRRPWDAPRSSCPRGPLRRACAHPPCAAAQGEHGGQRRLGEQQDLDDGLILGRPVSPETIRVEGHLRTIYSQRKLFCSKTAKPRGTRDCSPGGDGHCQRRWVMLAGAWAGRRRSPRRAANIVSHSHAVPSSPPTVPHLRRFARLDCQQEKKRPAIPRERQPWRTFFQFTVGATGATGVRPRDRIPRTDLWAPAKKHHDRPKPTGRPYLDCTPPKPPSHRRSPQYEPVNKVRWL